MIKQKRLIWETILFACAFLSVANADIVYNTWTVPSPIVGESRAMLYAEVQNAYDSVNYYAIFYDVYYEGVYLGSGNTASFSVGGYQYYTLPLLDLPDRPGGTSWDIVTHLYKWNNSIGDYTPVDHYTWHHPVVGDPYIQLSNLQRSFNAEGESIFSYTVDNTGNALSGSFDINVIYDGQPIGTASSWTEFPPAADPQTLSFNLGHPVAGSHTVRLESPHSFVQNSFTWSSDVQIYSVSDITWTETGHQISFSLRNVGNGVSKPFNIKLYYNGSNTGFLYSDAVQMSPGEDVANITLSFGGFLNAGTHAFLFEVVEPNGSSTLIDDNPSNNSRVNGTQVLTEDVAIHDVHAVLESDGSHSLNFSIANYGTGVSSLFNVDILEDGQVCYNDMFTDNIWLVPQQDESLQITGFFPPGWFSLGSHTAGALAKINDENNNNNSASDSFAVNYTTPAPNNFHVDAIDDPLLTFTWSAPSQPSPGVSLSGYRLYYGFQDYQWAGSFDLDAGDSEFVYPFNSGDYIFRMTALYETAYDEQIESAFSTSVSASVQPSTPPPPTPTGLYVTDPQNGDELELSWNPIYDSNLNHYHLLRNQGGAPTRNNHDADWMVYTTHFTDDTVEEGVTYYYAIQAASGLDDIHGPLHSDPSAPVSKSPTDTLAPAYPSGFFALPALNGVVFSTDLYWTRPAQNTDGSELTDFQYYRLEFRDLTTGGNWTLISETLSAVHYYHQMYGTGGHTLEYRLQALDDSGNASAYATTSVVMPEIDNPPAAPQNLTVLESPADDQSLVISWDASPESDVTSYRLYRKTDSGSFGLLQTLNATSYNDRNVQIGTLYTYYVTAVDAADQESPASNQDSNTPKQKLLEIISPTQLQPEQVFSWTGHGPVDIQWRIADRYRQLYPDGVVQMEIKDQNTGEIVYQTSESRPLSSATATFSWDGKHWREGDYVKGSAYTTVLALYLNKGGVIGDVDTAVRNIISAKIDIIPDYDRNGVINAADEMIAASGKSFRFWINDDDDNPTSAVSGDDTPGAGPDASSAIIAGSIDGIRDLVDFFPVCISISESALRDTDKYKYELLQTDGAIDYVHTDLDPEHAGNYLHDPATAESIANALTYKVGYPSAWGLGDTATLQRIKDEGNFILLLEASKKITPDKPLVFNVVSKESGLSVASAQLKLSIDSVEKMYRFKNLRADGTGRASSLGVPENYPDTETSGKNFVFVHGYNVSAEQGDATHAEVFKRMYQSGYNGKFWGVSWYGDVPSTPWTSHYHHSVVQAFAAAPLLRSFLTNSQYFSAPPDLAAHSLGNGVIGFALNDAPGTQQILNNYFALDAAVALEAYGDIDNNNYMDFPNGILVAINDAGETSDHWQSWTNYPPETWASEWHTLFDTTDHRSELTWRNRCSGVVPKVYSAYNFYSSTEEILRVDEGCSSYFSTLPGPTGVYAWQIQEWYKGQSAWLPASIAGGSSDQAGWGFVRDASSTNMHQVWNVNGWYFDTVQPPSWVEQQLANDPIGYKETLKSDPLFRHEPEILFSASGSDFVNSQVQNYNTELDYAPSTVDEVRNRDWLLAKAFPSRTRPMGSTPINPAAGWADSYNMSTDYRSHGWPRTDIYVQENATEWRHGDFKDVAYVYVQELYKKWVDLCK